MYVIRQPGSKLLRLWEHQPRLPDLKMESAVDLTEEKLPVSFQEA